MEALERLLLDCLEGSLQVLVAVRVKARVARVVVARVEIAEHLPCEVWDVLRITTGDMRIGQAWEQRLADGAVDRGVRSGERALHLIEDDALVAEAAVWIGWVLELVADSLLLECVFAQEREEGSVEVDLEQVGEILRVARAEEVHRPVAARERVHESRQRPARHTEERVSHRKLLRPRQDDMLEDVRDSGRIRWRRGKENREPVVVVGSLDVDVACARALVLELEVVAFEPVERFASCDRVACDLTRSGLCHVNL